MEVVWDIKMTNLQSLDKYRMGRRGRLEMACDILRIMVEERRHGIAQIMAHPDMSWDASQRIMRGLISCGYVLVEAEHSKRPQYFVTEAGAKLYHDMVSVSDRVRPIFDVGHYAVMGGFYDASGR